ncbi:DUF4139 domain-containing protein [Stakelama tenebrarum]|uniref:DUF4139 domain-containing protein n=1 Tax=Stakelama tenebrarum TaxID=2711215 RepID=A0A6G6Y3U5_9SPHN|nr:DUF4139 domain-containing protein [Sphingosinithalassobacter tenebrarum]QIG79283.1 DUF4139 domain-containing protein [Sphingosinithalassobacter tenebrarum]
MRVLALGLIVAGLPGAAVAQEMPGATAQGDVAVTIYNNDMALVQDTRMLALPAGRSQQIFPDVSARIRPETVTLAASGVQIVEQNFDYDLLTPEKLMDKAVGSTITLVRNGRSETARVLANNGGTIVQIGDRIEVLDDDSGRVVFGSLPSNLRARPTLSITMDSARAGTRPVTLTYLSRGLDWSADYVALFDETAGQIDVQGWVTLNNNSGTSFTNANTILVAGTPGQSGGGGRYGASAPRGNAPGTESANRERLGDYYLYPLAERTTIANAQQKQVSFLDVSGAPAAKAYYYRNGWLGQSSDAQSFDTVLRFSSSANGGLGDALPAGTVRVYMRDARGTPQFIGESNIGHTPMGSQLALKTGEAFDVKVQPTVVARTRINDRRWRTEMRYKFTNARPEDVTVEFVQAGLDSWWDDTRITQESMPSERRNSDQALWTVTVPANGEAEVTATFDTRF